MAHPLELTVKQAAIDLGLSERTVRRYLATAKLEGRKVERGQGRKEWAIDGDSVRRLAADTRKRGRGQKLRTDTLASEIRSLREEVKAQREQIARLTVEVERQGRALLPPPEHKESEGRWVRFWDWATRRATDK